MTERLQGMDESFYDPANATERSRTRWRYEALRRNLLVVMLCITLAPLGVAASVGYFQYRALIQREEVNQLRWHAERALDTFQLYLDGLKHDIVVTATNHTVAEMGDAARLAQVLTRLKAEHPTIVDLSLIDPDGVQIAYAGPYGLAGKDYRSSPWYERTLARKVHLSEIFLGFRNLPHFVVAATKENGHAGAWVVRASVDAETLDRFLATVGSGPLDDVFLVSDDGILQTSSRFHGKVLSAFAPSANPAKTGIQVGEGMRGREPILQAAVRVRNAPWILVLEQSKYGDMRLWSAFRTSLLAVSAITALFAGLVIVAVAKSLADRIRDAEETREAIVQESEHTSKLASIGRLAAGVAHEINNPLAIIREKAGLMKDLLTASRDTPHRDRYLAEITSLEDAVNRARVITHRLLGFARRMDVNLQPIQLNDVLREVIGFLDKEATYRDIRIEESLDPDLPRVESDTGQLQQIFLNLINNAIDAVDRGGTIRIASRVAEGGDGVVIDVKDDGPGIPPEVQRKMFEPFFTTKDHAERHGTGLGLSITYGLVQKLGGRIGVQSVMGKGTVFRLTFPLTPAFPEARAHA